MMGPVVLSIAIVAASEIYRHQEFNIELPDGFHVASPEALKWAKDFSSITYTAAFLSEPWDGLSFEYPYVLIQVFPYGPGRLTKDAALKMVRTITRVSVSQEIQDSLDEMLGAIVEIGQASASLDWPKRRFTWRVAMDVSGEVIQAEAAGYFGGKLIMVNFYDQAVHWSNSLGLRKRLRDSVTLTSEPPTGSGFDWSSVGAKALTGAVLGGLGGVVLWLIGYRKKTL